MSIRVDLGIQRQASFYYGNKGQEEYVLVDLFPLKILSMKREKHCVFKDTRGLKYPFHMQD